jgi:hypothetical protein
LMILRTRAGTPIASSLSSVMTVFPLVALR